MRQGISLGLILLCFAQTVLAANEAAVQIIVKYKQPTSISSLKKQIVQTINIPMTSFKPMAGDAYVVTFARKNFPQTGAQSVDASAVILEALRKNPNVEYALKDRLGYFKPVPNPDINELSPLLSHSTQWDEFLPPGGVMLESAAGLRDGAWAYTTGLSANPIVIAVLDTGIALHKSLLTNLVKDEHGKVWGWNFAANDSNLADETKSYHGTHVAGTIAGYGDVMTGMGENLKILPVKIPNSSGMFYESQVINAIYWSVGGAVPGVPVNSYPAKVLNMSFGIDERPGKEIDHCDAALQEAVQFARSKGAVLVVAAGNDNQREHFNAPAVCEGTIKVASTGPEGLRAYYSNYGPSINFAAPGGDFHYGKKGGILSTVNPNGGYEGSGYEFYQGTSMASPHVAGVTGLVIAAATSAITLEKVEQILNATTHAFGKTNDKNNSCVGNKSCGHGILDAKNAVEAAIANFDVIFTAPLATRLPMKLCNKDVYQLTANSLQEQIWIPIKINCENTVDSSLPQVEQTKKGKITANYGTVTYELANYTFKHCQLIGFKGIGCYL